MNKTIILISLASLLFLNSNMAQDSIPNQDFENWITNTTPKNWESTNLLLPPGNIVCTRTTNSYSGDYALQLKTISLDSIAIPGVLTLGEIGMGYTAGGVAFTDKPTSLKGYFTHPSTNDEVSIFVQFYKNGIEIGGGGWTNSDSISDFTEFVLPISFPSSQNPDTLNITMLTDPFAVGSTLIIDALQFEYTTTNIDKKNELNFNLFPNPCSNNLSIDINTSEDYTISIHDLSGKQLSDYSMISHNKIDISSLNPGTYIIILKSAIGISRNKFVKL